MYDYIQVMINIVTLPSIILRHDFSAGTGGKDETESRNVTSVGVAGKRRHKPDKTTGGGPEHVQGGDQGVHRGSRGNQRVI